MLREALAKSSVGTVGTVYRGSRSRRSFREESRAECATGEKDEFVTNLRRRRCYMRTCEIPSEYMATSTVADRHEIVERASPDVFERVLPMNVCPPSNFPDKFQDFFAALTEDGDDLPSMLEDKLIPR